jgi:hypothetical protein
VGTQCQKRSRPGAADLEVVFTLNATGCTRMADKACTTTACAEGNDCVQDCGCLVALATDADMRRTRRIRQAKSEVDDMMADIHAHQARGGKPTYGAPFMISQWCGNCGWLRGLRAGV